MNHDVSLRMATVEDAPVLLAIYAPYVLHTPITFEYDVPSTDEFAGRIEHTLARFPYLVATRDGVPIGYAYASPFRTRAAYQWGVETSIYLREDARGTGVGRMLYGALEDVLTRQHVLNVNACITYPNPESVAFHERMGYRTVAHFTKCGYKFGKWHDMIWMEKMLGEHADNPAPIVPVGELKPGL